MEKTYQGCFWTIIIGFVVVIICMIYNFIIIWKIVFLSKIEIFIGVSGDKGTNPQLARLHAMIREIAQEIGYTFVEAKIEVKRAAGLCFVRDKQEYCKSFGDCDKDELNLAIQACVEIGDFNGMQLR